MPEGEKKINQKVTLTILPTPAEANSDVNLLVFVSQAIDVS